MQKNILVIDDEDQIRSVIKKMLEAEGYLVTVTADGNAGLDFLRNNSVDLLITDIVMPDKEGIEIIRELKKNSPDLGIIAISGGGSMGPEEYLFLAKKFGVNKTLAKPFRREDLLSAVKDVLG
jgi:CheY-like chemotaxis protein